MKSLAALTLMIFVKTFGNIFLSRGMHEMGNIHLMRLMNKAALLTLGTQIAFDPWIIVAVSLMALYFLLYLSSLSWLDLSFVLPITTAGYALNTLLSWLILHETVAATRWIGTFLIMGGVFLVGLEKYNEKIR